MVGGGGIVVGGGGLDGLTVVTAVCSINHHVDSFAVSWDWKLSLPRKGERSKLIDHYPGADPGNEGDSAGLDLPGCTPQLPASRRRGLAHTSTAVPECTAHTQPGGGGQGDRGLALLKY